MKYLLTELLKKVKWVWGEVQYASFDGLIYTLASAPIIQIADFYPRFIVETDAYNVAVGALFT